MAIGRGFKDITATPVKVLTDEEAMERGVYLGLATPVVIVNKDEICLDCDGSGGGGTGDLTYVFNQGVPSTTWNITHNLGKFPSVTIVDSSGRVVIGDVTHVNNDQLTVTFNSAFSGKAYLN